MDTWVLPIHDYDTKMLIKLISSTFYAIVYWHLCVHMCQSSYPAFVVQNSYFVHMYLGTTKNHDYTMFGCHICFFLHVCQLLKYFSGLLFNCTHMNLCTMYVPNEFQVTNISHLAAIFFHFFIFLIYVSGNWSSCKKLSILCMYLYYVNVHMTYSFTVMYIPNLLVIFHFYVNIK